MTAVFFEDSAEVFYHECDNCNSACGPVLTWKDKDFALCFKCLTALSNEHLGTKHEFDNTVVVHRKTISESLRAEILKKYNYRCAVCESDKKLQIDHIIPWSMGGLTTRDNLQILCQVCNIKKGNSL